MRDEYQNMIGKKTRERENDRDQRVRNTHTVMENVKDAGQANLLGSIYREIQCINPKKDF